MSWKNLTVSTAVLLAAAGWTWADADDTLRLDGKGGAATLKLGSKVEADNLLVRGWHGGGYRPAYRYGYRGYSHFGSYRSWYPRYYRPYYGGFYWPGRAWAFGLNVWPAYYNSYYYSPPAVIYSAPAYRFYYPPAVGVAPLPSTPILSTPQIEVAPPPAVRPSADGTYPYDGGPKNPVPLPKVEPAPTAVPPAAIVPGGRVVSLPAPSGRYTYLGYGEKPQQRSPQMTQITQIRK